MKYEFDLKLTPRQLAELFCDMDDDAQAQFFVECAAVMEEWPAHARLMQLHLVGEHLRDCKCSTDEGRELVRNIFASMEHRE